MPKKGQFGIPNPHNRTLLGPTRAELRAKRKAEKMLKNAVNPNLPRFSRQGALNPDAVMQSWDPPPPGESLALQVHIEMGPQEVYEPDRIIPCPGRGVRDPNEEPPATPGVRVLEPEKQREAMRTALTRLYGQNHYWEGEGEHPVDEFILAERMEREERYRAARAEVERDRRARRKREKATHS